MSKASARKSNTTNKLVEMINHFESTIAYRFGEKTFWEKKKTRSKNVNSDYYPYIPFDIKFFINGLYDLRSKFELCSKIKFVDVGCGIGTKMLLASLIGKFDVYGIEYNPKLRNFALDLLMGHSGLNKCIILGDALKQDYSKYDIIYYYTPICNKDKMQTLRKLIGETMKDSALVATPDFDPYSKTLKIQTKKEYLTTIDKVPNCF